MLILKEAFPSVDAGVIKAVLSASRGQVESAFNALLEMTDPDAAAQNQEPENPPPQPPRPAGGGGGRSQLEADELYARQLAQHYENVGAYEARTANTPPRQTRRQPQQQQQQQRPMQTGTGEEDREYSFMDDELPVIRENLKKGFAETQTKVFGLIQQFKKKIDETFEEGEGSGRQNAGAQAGLWGGQGGSGSVGRRSNDHDRYDADPLVLGDDFSGITLNDGTLSSAHFDGNSTGLTEVGSKAGAPINNPNMFKPPPSEGCPAFREALSDDIYSTSPRPPPKDGSSAASKPAVKQSKWQPLSTVDPHPVAENDPFSLGDSDDEGEPKKPANTASDATTSDSERVKAAAAEAMAESLVADKKEGDAAKKE